MKATSPSASDSGLTITVSSLSKRFNREWIFRNLQFDFTPGRTYAITGPNGSGKSTLLQVLWGQVPPTSGNIQYSKGNAPVAVEEVFRHLSIATPYLDLIEEFTLAEMLRFHFRLRKMRKGCSPTELLRILYLEDAADKQLRNFSSGMKQRLKLGLAFYTEADVYFLDEPGTNLDKKAFAWYKAELGKLPEHATIFIASNNPEEYPADAQRLDMLDYKP